jgi:hypothetical protein
VIPRPGGLLARRYPNAAVMLGNSLVPT